MHQPPTPAQISRLVRVCTAARYARARSLATADRRMMHAVIAGDVQDALDRRTARLRRTDPSLADLAREAHSDARALQRLYPAARAVMTRQADAHGWTQGEALEHMEAWIDAALEARAKRR